MDQANKEQYMALISEIVAKQAVILGPEIAVLKARNVRGLTVADDGTVTDMQGDYTEIIHKLVDEYVALSGQIVKSALTSVFTKYPTINKID